MIVSPISTADPQTGMTIGKRGSMLSSRQSQSNTVPRRAASPPSDPVTMTMPLAMNPMAVYVSLSDGSSHSLGPYRYLIQIMMASDRTANVPNIDLFIVSDTSVTASMPHVI